MKKNSSLNRFHFKHYMRRYSLKFGEGKDAEERRSRIYLSAYAPGKAKTVHFIDNISELRFFDIFYTIFQFFALS